MSVRSLQTAIVIAAVLPSFAFAQHGGPGDAPTSTTPPAEAKQFNFLVGQWELDIQPAISSLAAAMHGQPKFAGSWKAWPALDGWGIEDELRISDKDGNPRGIAHTVRVYDATRKRWTNSNLDVWRATFTASSGEWRQGPSGPEMIAMGRSVDQNGNVFASRTRFHDIKPNSFRADSERSTDDGKSWTTVRRIVAKRVAAVAPR